MGSVRLLLGIVVILLGVAALSAIYTVHEREQAPGSR